MKNKLRAKGEQRVRYNPKIGKKGAFGNSNEMSENFILVQLMEALGNVNRNISIVGYWIFESNYKQALCLTR